MLVSVLGFPKSSMALQWDRIFWWEGSTELTSTIRPSVQTVRPECLEWYEPDVSGYVTSP